MAFPGMPPGPPPGMPPGMPMGMGAPPGGDQGALPDLAMSSLDQLGNGNQESEALARVDEALNLAHKLIMSVLPQVSNVNPRVSKDLHQIAQRVLQVKLDVQKDMPMGEPPAELMALLNSGDQAPGVGNQNPTPSPSPMMG